MELWRCLEALTSVGFGEVVEVIVGLGRVGNEVGSGVLVMLV